MPIYITGSYNVYDIYEVNNLLNLKADKVANENNKEHIATLNESEGNLQDSGLSLDDLIVTLLDGGTF